VEPCERVSVLHRFPVPGIGVGGSGSSLRDSKSAAATHSHHCNCAVRGSERVAPDRLPIHVSGVLNRTGALGPRRPLPQGSGFHDYAAKSPKTVKHPRVGRGTHRGLLWTPQLCASTCGSRRNGLCRIDRGIGGAPPLRAWFNFPSWPGCVLAYSVFVFYSFEAHTNAVRRQVKQILKPASWGSIRSDNSQAERRRIAALSVPGL
jgi:hypothetical protein